MNNYLSILVLLSLTVLAGCDNNTVYSEYEDIDDPSYESLNDQILGKTTALSSLKPGWHFFRSPEFTTKEPIYTQMIPDPYPEEQLPGLADKKLAAAIAKDEWVLFKVRDHGQGVTPEHLPQLTKPFFRGDAARTAANGAGLGLSIVEKTLERMGGKFALVNTRSGGLAAHIKLQRAY